MACYNSQNVGQVDPLGLGHSSRSVDKYNLRTSITPEPQEAGGLHLIIPALTQALDPPSVKLQLERLILKECLDGLKLIDFWA